MSGAGISFAETMSGPFALGETDAQAGARAGKAAGHTLAMHAAVTIPDLDRFIADESHPGALTGTLDYAPLGTGIAARRGVFNLFSPGAESGTRYMVYELAFRHQGEDHYLAGRKIVRDDPGLDLWRDTTTLFTTLHRGGDASGPVIGAGVLSLGGRELGELVTTIRVTGAEGSANQAQALAKFGQFFLGQLWERYGPR